MTFRQYCRVLKMIRFLDHVPLEEFNLNVVLRERSCRTVACAIGMTPQVFPDLVQTQLYHNRPDHRRFIVVPKDEPVDEDDLFVPDSVRKIAKYLFGFSREESLIFFACYYDDTYGCVSATPGMVAQEMRKIARKWRKRGFEDV